MGARVWSTAAVLTAAVAVCGLVVRARLRRLRRKALSERLVAGRVAGDNSVLRADVERFRHRLAVELAAGEAVAVAGRVVDEALARSAVPPPGGGSGSGVDPLEGGSS